MVQRKNQTNTRMKKKYRKINGGQNKMGKKEENKRKDTGGDGREKIRKR